MLFICGGAFDGLERIIESRVAANNMGFRANPEGKRDLHIGKLFQQLMPEDLLRFGLIPEFIGRLPIVVTLDALDELALRRILTEPRNALVRQFQKILGMDGVDLQFTKEALVAIAHQSSGPENGRARPAFDSRRDDARGHVRSAFASERQEVRRQQRRDREEGSADVDLSPRRPKERHAGLGATFAPSFDKLRMTTTSSG